MTLRPEAKNLRRGYSMLVLTLRPWTPLALSASGRRNSSGPKLSLRPQGVREDGTHGTVMPNDEGIPAAEMLEGLET